MSEGRTQSPPGVTHSQTPVRSLTGRKKDLGLFRQSNKRSRSHFCPATSTCSPQPTPTALDLPRHRQSASSSTSAFSSLRTTTHWSILVLRLPLVHHHRTATSHGRRPGSPSSFTTTAKPPSSPPPPLPAADAREVRLCSPPPPNHLAHHHHHFSRQTPGKFVSRSFTTTTKPPSSPPPPLPAADAREVRLRSPPPPPPPLPGKFMSPRSPPPNHHLPRAADAPLIHHDHHFPRHMSSSFARTLLAAIRQAPSPNLLLRILNKILEAPSPTAGPHFPLFQQYLLSLADEILAPPRPSDKPAWIYSYIAPSSQLSLPLPAAPDNLDIKIGRTRKLPRRQQQWALQCPGEPQFWVVAFLVPFAIKFGGLVEAILHRHYKLSGAWRGPTPCDYCPRSHIERFSLFRVGGIAGFCDVMGYYSQALQWPIYYTVL
ncbi:hypothetical protein C8J57DRAFT_1215132 [Mycena rebaudengoi]|nr:hypothetical protein C8J57DRAFT_1215132 [Mycena rebaudengoi]